MIHDSALVYHVRSVADVKCEQSILLCQEYRQFFFSELFELLLEGLDHNGARPMESSSSNRSSGSAMRIAQ